MNKREAALILECSYVNKLDLYLFARRVLTHPLQRARSEQGDRPQETPTDDHAEPPRPRRQPLLSDEDQRGENVFGQEYLRTRRMYDC